MRQLLTVMSCDERHRTLHLCGLAARIQGYRFAQFHSIQLFPFLTGVFFDFSILQMFLGCVCVIKTPVFKRYSQATQIKFIESKEDRVVPLKSSCKLQLAWGFPVLRLTFQKHFGYNFYKISII